jgi:hypothetical protein
MEKKSAFMTTDGRRFDIVMNWDERIKDSEHVFPIACTVTEKTSGRPMKLPREIATIAFGDPEESIGDRVKYYYEGNRELMIIDYVETACRRLCDYVQRGK